MSSTLAAEQQEVRGVYRRRARWYNVTSHAYGLLGYQLSHYRRHAIESLQLKPGNTVVEIGCGTGANLPDLVERVGPTGRVIGVDLTDAMLNVARRRIAEAGWRSVELVESDAAKFEFPPEVDGVLSTFAITLSPQYDDVIDHAVRALTPEGRIAIADLKAPERWPTWLVRMVVPILQPFAVSMEYVNRHPWESVRRRCASSKMTEYFLGTTYVIVGTAPGNRNAKEPI